MKPEVRVRLGKVVYCLGYIVEIKRTWWKFNWWEMVGWSPIVGGDFELTKRNCEKIKKEVEAAGGID